MLGYPTYNEGCKVVEYDFAKEISDDKTKYIPFNFTNKDFFKMKVRMINLINKIKNHSWER